MTIINKLCERFDEELMEKLADIEHQRWADWQKYCHSKFIEDGKDIGFCKMPLTDVLRWDRQIKTTYKDLSEPEKQSDRNQVERYKPLIHSFLRQSFIELLEEVEKEIIKEQWLVNDGTARKAVFVNDLKDLINKMKQ